MAIATFKASKPDFSKLRALEKPLERAHYRAAIEATDIASKKAQVHIQAKMRSVGLGRLSMAVGQTSSKKKRQQSKRPYGVIYARAGDESLAGGALEAYSRGTTIRAQNSEWLAYSTDAVPRLVNVGGRRKRITPSRYMKAGLSASIGKLIFRKVKPNLALLVLRKVSLSPKTGRARPLGKRPPRTRVVPKGDVVAFVLIRQTRRSKRFDKDQIMRQYSARTPDYIARILRDLGFG